MPPTRAKRFLLPMVPFVSSFQSCIRVVFCDVHSARDRPVPCFYLPFATFNQPFVEHYQRRPTQLASRHVPIALGTLSNLEHYFTLLSTFLIFEQNLNIFSLFGLHSSTVLQFSICLMQCFVFETFSVSRVIIIMNLNNFTLSPYCCHKNAQLTQLSF